MTEPSIKRRLSSPIRKYDNEFSARTALVGWSPWTAVGALADLGGTKASRADRGVRPTRRNTSRYLRTGVLRQSKASSFLASPVDDKPNGAGPVAAGSESLGSIRRSPLSAPCFARCTAG